MYTLNIFPRKKGAILDRVIKDVIKMRGVNCCPRPKSEKFDFKMLINLKKEIFRLLKCSKIAFTMKESGKYSNKIKQSGRKDFGSTLQSTNILISN